MLIDLHNHTPLCNHAQGELFEYIEKAIEAKTQYFGFSDHAPMEFDSHYRMRFEQMQNYEKEVLNLKKKYQNKITILLGYEVDFLVGYMDTRVLNAQVDYLIGSIHFIDDWGFDNPEFIGRYENENLDEIWQKYFNAVEEMAKSKLFDIVGHLDLIKVFKYMPSRAITDIAKNAMLAIKNADMALELNVAGLRKPIKETYPSLELLQMAYKLEIPITFGSDAHQPEQVGLYSDEIQQMAKTVGYTQCAIFENRKRRLINF